MMESARRLPGVLVESPAPAISHSRGRFSLWACAYGVAVLYASIALGPSGFNFVSRDPEVAWRTLVAIPLSLSHPGPVADLTANLLMLVPLGFFTTGALWPRRNELWQAVAAGTALCGCITFVIAVKYAQLFFPPRTVSFPYILSQILGALSGGALFWLFSYRLATIQRELILGSRRGLLIGLGLYAAAYFLYILFPFEFITNTNELRQRLASIPELFLSWPGAGLPDGLRVILAVAAIASTTPFGIFLALTHPGSLPKIALAGFLMMSATAATSLFLMHVNPSLGTILGRTAGIVIGASLVSWLAGSDPERWRRLLARLVPLVILPYLVAVLYVKNLLSLDWRSLPEAWDSINYRGLLPFWHHYIVSKPHAARGIAAELVCFGVVGILVALRRGSSRGSISLAGSIALLFALAIEFGRWFKPGLQPDFTNPIIAAVGAALAVQLTGWFFWRALGSRQIGDPAGRAEYRVNGKGDPISSLSPAFATARDAERLHPSLVLVRLAVALICLAAAAVVVSDYPLAPGVLGAVLGVYGAALWVWPSLWLVVLPAALPAYDLSLWTGWTLIGEPDLFALVTIGVLILRAPPRWSDFRMRWLPALAIFITVVSYIASTGLGLAFPEPVGGSDNPYLRPDNALRLAKGLFFALTLMPFLRERLRARTDAMAWFSAGMVLGLALVSGATLVERAVFPGLLDFTVDYRVVATFSSMQIGGGYVGAYLALALPFLLVFLLRPSPAVLAAMCAISACAGYALMVTFARTAYAGALLATVVSCLAWAWAAARHGTERPAFRLLPVLMLLLVASITMIGVGTPLMAERLHQVLPDFATREANWEQGLALRSRDPSAVLFGMGLGTYPRVVLARNSQGEHPANFVVAQDGGYRYLTLNAASPTYFGQKVSIEPDRQYRLFLAWRSPDGKGRLSISLCEKILLYSENCRGTSIAPQAIGKWNDFGTVISTIGLSGHTVLRWFGRPVELTLFNAARGTTIDIGHVRLLDPENRDILANGDFSRGTERWLFTDDEHRVWRILNQYLMSFFETGALGLTALMLLLSVALAGAIGAIWRGERIAAPVVGALVAFLCSSMFDHLLAAPRLAMLLYLIAFWGLSMTELPHAGARAAGVPVRSRAD